MKELHSEVARHLRKFGQSMFWDLHDTELVIKMLGRKKFKLI